MLNLLSTLSIVRTELFCGQDFFVWLSPNKLLKRKTFLKTIVPFCQKFIISCYGYCWREGGQFSLNLKNPKLSSATVKNTLSKFLHSRTDADGNQNQDMLRTPDYCFGNFKGKFSLSMVKSGEECRLYGMCKWRGLLVFLLNGFLNCFSET